MKRSLTCGLLAVLALMACPQGARADDGKKEVWPAPVLAWLVGFGSGHYYAQDHRAIWITGAEVGSLGLMVAGGGSDSAWMATGGLLTLVGVRLYELVDSFSTVGRYNKRHTDRLASLPFDLSLGDPLTASLGNSKAMASLWEEGGASRDYALALSAAQAYAKPVRSAARSRVRAPAA